MKIAFTGLDLPPGKIKHRDEIFTALVEKFHPAKVSPYYFELLPEDYEAAAAVAISADSLLDLLIPDLEKIERRLERDPGREEREVLEKCRTQLEDEKPVCDLVLDESEQAVVRLVERDYPVPEVSVIEIRFSV